MKKTIACATLGILAIFCKPASAQYPVKIQNNVQEQPSWGPRGHDYAEYYYIPEIETYYYIPGKQFIYQSGGYWTFSSFLPEANKHFDLRSANKIVINEPGPYRFFDRDKVKYGHPSVAASSKQPEESTGSNN